MKRLLPLMNKLHILIIACLSINFVSGCAAYKITLDEKAISLRGETELLVSNTNDFPQGAHYFEPYLHVVTVGLIPTHCKHNYSIKGNQQPSLVGTAIVTSMQGWVSLLLAPFPHWQYGYFSKPEEKITAAIQGK